MKKAQLVDATLNDPRWATVKARSTEADGNFYRADLIGGDADFEQLVAQVVAFIEAPGIGLDLPLDVRGTSFQQRVWQALCEIPVGQTVRYTDIARRIGSPHTVRAVRNDGALAGYRWGVERKRSLLEKEAGEEVQA
ncbi:O-6-methylguanine DNA methyltransferase [Nitrosospira multiformis]|uniref:O-6-methylguanine DNA methyltransferase n=2 Tax=Nitrosospira multiformis TaxID=1231 RepID=A0A2T5I9M1_9PROT|nr:O-6-methylguanine DNA methyltransferase [Nitrosospira multiformis]